MFDGLSAHVVIFNGYVLYHGKKTIHIQIKIKRAIAIKTSAPT
jgi:hypothetical protein